jgi:hypothetical protein
LSHEQAKTRQFAGSNRLTLKIEQVKSVKNPKNMTSAERRIELALAIDNVVATMSHPLQYRECRI